MNRMLALAGLILLSPLFFVLILSIIAIDHMPPLFAQTRLGLNEDCFIIYKLRTMKDGKATKLGGGLRKLHLDELPQLWNVFNGSMAFVGPRPLLCAYKGDFHRSENFRHFVKPGITGLAQILGSKDLSWERQFAMDRYYATSHNLVLDLWILWKTINRFLKPSPTDVIELREWNR